MAASSAAAPTPAALQRAAAEMLRQEPSEAQLKALRETVLALPGLLEAHDRMALEQAEAMAETAQSDGVISLSPVRRLTDPRVAFVVWPESSAHPVVFRVMLNAQALGRLNQEYLLNEAPDTKALQGLRALALSFAPGGKGPPASTGATSQR